MYTLIHKKEDGTHFVKEYATRQELELEFGTTNVVEKTYIRDVDLDKLETYSPFKQLATGVLDATFALGLLYNFRQHRPGAGTPVCLNYMLTWDELSILFPDLTEAISKITEEEEEELWNILKKEGIHTKVFVANRKICK